MSDLFSDFESAAPAPATNEADPAAAFLASQQAEMARIENDPDDEDNRPQQSNAFGDDDFFGSTATTTTSSSAVDPFAAPIVASNDDNSATAASSNPYSAISQADKIAQEPEKIKKWREEQKLRLSTKDAEEEQKKKEMREAAKKELDDWYKQRQEQLAKTHANNKINNKAAEAELVSQREACAPGQEWERTAKLCDFNPKGNKNVKDVSRMRSILLQLKQTPLVR